MKRSLRGNRFLFCIRLTAFASLSGCATPMIGYVQPTGLTPRSGASIVGSLNVDPNPLKPNTHVFLMAVDNLPAHRGWKGWNTPTLVTPGVHLLTFGPCQCNGWAPTGPIGSITLAENFQAGENYILRSSVPKGGAFFTPILATAWIQDSSGTPMSPPTTVQLQAPPAPIFLPVIIPAR
jgi:hypothetical protein